MIITLMRFRTGKFGVRATEVTKANKTINNDSVLMNLKRELGARCVEYRIDEKDGINHIWTFKTITAVTRALEGINWPSTDNDEPEN